MYEAAALEEELFNNPTHIQGAKVGETKPRIAYSFTPRRTSERKLLGVAVLLCY